jgi:hypothetical protein
MSGDWLKMSTGLYRDPKVITMASIVFSKTGRLASEVSRVTSRDMSVTQNVTRCAVVGALLNVWGVFRHQGRRVGDDLVVTSSSVEVVDAVSELTGLGTAMLSVGWLKVEAGNVIFPRFFEENNVDPKDKKRKSDAERKRRQRERERAERDRDIGCDIGRDCHADVRRDVTGQSRIEKEIEKEGESYSDDVTLPPDSGIGPTSHDGGLVIAAWNETAERRCGPGGYAPYSGIVLSNQDFQKLKDIWCDGFVANLKGALKATPERGTGKSNAITLGSFLAFSDTRDFVLSFKPRRPVRPPMPPSMEKTESQRIAEAHERAKGSPEAKAAVAKLLAKEKEKQDAAIVNSTGRV